MPRVRPGPITHYLVPALAPAGTQRERGAQPTVIDRDLGPLAYENRERGVIERSEVSRGEGLAYGRGRIEER